MNQIYNCNASEYIFIPASKVAQILPSDTANEILINVLALFSWFFDKAGFALTVSFFTLAWRLYDKYRERTEKVLVDSWIKTVLEPVCITPLREKLLEIDMMYCEILKIQKETPIEYWSAKYRDFLDYFSNEMVTIDARFRVIGIINKKSYLFIQLEIEKIEDMFAKYYEEVLNSEINLKGKEATEQMVRTQIYTTLNLISRNCFQLVHSGKVRKYLKQIPI